MIYRNVDNSGDNACGSSFAVDTDPGWALIGTTAATTFTDSAIPASDCVYYSIRLKFKGVSAEALGPDTSAGFITTHQRSAVSPGVSQRASIVIVSNFQVSYIGKNSFRASWNTGSEAGIASFNLLRSTSQDGGYTQVGSVAAKGEVGGSSYTLLDKVNRSQGTTLYYELQAQNIDKTMAIVAGPVVATLPHGGGNK